MVGLFAASLSAQAIEFKPYAGAGVGSFIIDAGLGAENAFGGYGILGADLHENFGIEFRLGTTGNTGNTVMVPVGRVEQQPILVPTPATVAVDWFVSYLLKVQYPVNEAFSIYGLVGATTLNSKFVFPSIPSQVNSTKTAFSFGGGVDYGLGNQWTLGIDAMVYANDANTNAGANFKGLDVWGLTATAKYKF